MRWQRSDTSAEANFDMRYTVDTSVWVSVFLIGEPVHNQSRKFLRDLIQAGDEVVIPTTVYLEVIMAVGRRERTTEIRETVSRYLLSISNIQFVDIDYVRMLAIARETSALRLRGMDAILVGVAKEFDAELVTLDAELAARAKAMVRVVKLER